MNGLLLTAIQKKVHKSPSMFLPLRKRRRLYPAHMDLMLSISEQFEDDPLADSDSQAKEQVRGEGETVEMLEEWRIKWRRSWKKRRSGGRGSGARSGKIMIH